MPTTSDREDPTAEPGLGAVSSLGGLAAVVAENAVDDTEDLPDDDTVEVKKTNSYGRRRHSNHKYHKIHEKLDSSFHPNIRPLTISDLESCVVLENAAFTDPSHRCSREKFEYRLTVSPELCLGLFCTIVPDNANGVKLSTFPPSHPVETGRKDGARSVLLAHIVATRTDGMFVTDEAMDYPRDFRVSKHNTSGLGHNDTGSTVCIHSLAVHPELQGCGLGRLIMKSYLQQLKNSEIAESCALICQNHLIAFYERFGFEYLGTSGATIGSGGWHDMFLKVDNLPPYSMKPGRG